MSDDSARSFNHGPPERPDKRAGTFDGTPESRSSILPILRDTGAKTSPQSRPLAYLDGLRGIAALMVYFQHHITQFYGDSCDITKIYGYKETHHFAALPFVRVFFTGGAPAVMIFFVLSGYVLSRSSLRMLRDGQSPSRHLLSACLRRPIRLFLPPLLLSLPVAFMLHTPFKPLTNPVPIQDGIFLELAHYAMEMIRTFNPFIGHGPFLQNFRYNPPTWTMAYELNGSLLVFASVAVLGPRFTPKGRILTWALIGFVMFYTTHWSMPCFLVGAILAQIDVEDLDHEYLKRLATRTRWLVLNGTFVLAWFLLSLVRSRVLFKKPVTGEIIELTKRSDEEDTTTPKPQPPVDYLAYVLPFPFNFHHWLFGNMIGAMILVYAILRLPWLQHILGTTRFFRFLGRISFALYLTHEPLKWIIAVPLSRMLGNAPGKKDDPFAFDGALSIPDLGMQGLSSRYLAMQVVMLPLNLILADFLTRTVDDSTVKASKLFANKVMQRLGC